MRGMMSGTVLVTTMVSLSATAPSARETGVVANMPAVFFHQADTQFDGQVVQNTGWGLAEVLYEGAPDILYLNVIVNGSWQIENVPMMSVNGAGVVHRQFYAFDLGVPHGQDVQMIDYGVSITPQVLDDPPPMNQQAQVQDLLYHIDAGVQGTLLRLGQPGKILADTSKRRPPRRPPPNINQPQGPKECVPGAVSNALKRLNEMLPPRRRVAMELIMIPALKAPLAWSLEAGGCHPTNWPDLKKAYVESIRMPVTTEVVLPSEDGAEMRAVMKKLVAARAKNCMIEMTVDGHCVLVESIAKVEGRNDYTFEVAHDISQTNNPETAVVQTVTYDPTTNKITGGWMMEGKTVTHWVIECIDRPGGGYN